MALSVHNALRAEKIDRIRIAREEQWWGFDEWRARAIAVVEEKVREMDGMVRRGDVTREVWRGFEERWGVGLVVVEDGRWVVAADGDGV